MATFDFEKSLAVVIGIDQYCNGIAPLQTAVADSQAVASLLAHNYEYQVLSLLDEAAQLTGLQELIQHTLPSLVSANSRLLLYFAGHGIAQHGDNGPAGYLIPQDAMPGNVDSYLSMVSLHDALAALPCRHFLAIFDCCFAGAFRWSSTRKVTVVDDVIYRERYDRFRQNPAWQVITSASYDQPAMDVLSLRDERGEVVDSQSQRHSPFAAALLQALQGDADSSPPAKEGKPAGDGVITATELYLYLRDQVEVLTESRNLRQTPEICSLRNHDKGEYIFLTPGHALNLPAAPKLDESNNPFLGLRSFETSDSQFFFGRDKIVERLHTFVKTHPLTVVLGASGSGKSSLIKAGLIPRLQQESTQKWFVLSPIRPGKTPFKALNSALVEAKLLPIERQGQSDSFARSIEAWLQLHPDSQLLIVVDQSEEIITLCSDVLERQYFFAQVLTAIEAHRDKLRIVLSLRSDFEPQVRDAGLNIVDNLDSALDATDLRSRWQSERFIVPAMTRAELREAIEKPAALKVMHFQPHDLVERLIDEVANMPGALPLLSFALSELYLRYLKRQHEASVQGLTIDRALMAQDYHALGGVIQSLTQKANEEYENLVKQDAAFVQSIRHVMLRMVAIGGGELARRRVLLSELVYPPEQNLLSQAVVERFSAARLLVSGQDVEGNAYIEPAHDALVRGWEKIQTWLATEKNLTLQRRLTPLAVEWSHQRQQKFLWEDNPYLDVLDKEVRQSLDNNWLNQVEAVFVEKSLQNRRKNKIIRRSFVSGAILLLSTATGLALNYSRISQNRLLEASSNLAMAQLSSNEALDALVEATVAGESLQKIPGFIVNAKTESHVIDTLRRIVRNVYERNRLVTDEPIMSMSFTPARGANQTLIAVGLTDGRVEVRSLEGDISQALDPEVSDDLLEVEFSDDGQTLVGFSKHQGIYVWQRQADNTFVFQQTIGHSASIMSATLSPSNDLIAIGSWEDNTVRLVGLDGQRIKEFGEHKHGDRINDIAFSPGQGKLFASGSAKDGVVKIWDTKKRTLIKSFTIEKTIVRLRFVDDQLLAIASSDGSIELRDIEGTLRRTLEARHDGDFSGLAVSRDGKRIASAGRDGHIKISRVEDGIQLQTLLGHQAATIAVDFVANDTEILSASSDRTLRLWQTEKNQPPLLPGRSLSFSPDSQTIATAQGEFVYLWNPDGTPIHQFSTGSENITVLRFGHSDLSELGDQGSVIVIADREGKIKLWHPDGTLLNTLSGHNDSVTSLSFSPKGNRLVSGSVDNSILLWDLDGNLLQQFDAESVVTSVSFSPNGEMVAAATDTTVKLWQVDGTLRNIYEGHLDTVYSVSFSPDGYTVASASVDGYIHLWSTHSPLHRGRRQEPFLAHEDGVSRVTFEAGGKTLISGGLNDDDIKVWSLEGKLLQTLSRAQADSAFAGVLDIGVSPDGKAVATAGYEQVSLWDLKLDRLLEDSCHWLRDYLKHPPSGPVVCSNDNDL